MSTLTVIGPLHYCRCGHIEGEHREWMFGCSACACSAYKRDHKRRVRVPSCSTCGDTRWLPCNFHRGEPDGMLIGCHCGPCPVCAVPSDANGWLAGRQHGCSDATTTETNT